jgi:hypothetical protein
MTLKAAGIGGIRCGIMNLARTSLKMLALCTLVLTTACADDGSGDTDTDSTTAATDATATDATAASDTTPTTTGDASTGDASTGGAPAVAYKDIQAIWDGKCVMFCHTPGGSAAAMGPLLGADVSYANIVDKATPSAPIPYIAPGDPDGSYLWAKLKGTQAEVGGGGSPMPLGVPLDDATLATIEQWILEGANP